MWFIHCRHTHVELNLMQRAKSHAMCIVQIQEIAYRKRQALKEKWLLSWFQEHERANSSPAAAPVPQ